MKRYLLKTVINYLYIKQDSDKKMTNEKIRKIKLLNEETPVQCEYCGKEYNNFIRLKDHVRSCHSQVYHICSICSKQFQKKWLLNIHVREHTGEMPYRCIECDKTFISKSKMKIHMNFHHGKNGMRCKICNAIGFYSKQDLDNHSQTKHTKERPFHCNLCNKSFMSSGVYYQHRNIHNNVKKYSCTVCSKSFNRYMTLHNHLRIHNNERPFPCDICGRAFRQKGDMKRHKMTQHSKVYVQMVESNIC